MRPRLIARLGIRTAGRIYVSEPRDGVHVERVTRTTSAAMTKPSVKLPDAALGVLSWSAAFCRICPNPLNPGAEGADNTDTGVPKLWGTRRRASHQTNHHEGAPPR
jgi:hypothetical protein